MRLAGDATRLQLHGAAFKVLVILCTLVALTKGRRCRGTRILTEAYERGRRAPRAAGRSTVACVTTAAQADGA